MYDYAPNRIVFWNSLVVVIHSLGYKTRVAVTLPGESEVIGYPTIASLRFAVPDSRTDLQDPNLGGAKRSI